MSQLQKYEAKDFECITDGAGELGAGGFGVVRYAFHRVLGPVALKCFPVTGGSQDKKIIVDEMKNELDLLQKANHARVLRVHGWTEWSGSMAIVMEYMPGGNLFTLLRNKQSKLSTVLRLRVCVEVSDAISFIHNLTPAKRLVHGDIKPENVLVSDELHCKLGDFGAATLSGYTVKVADLADMEKQKVSPYYAAPEQLAPDPAEPRRDQDTYSFGLIIYTVLTGEVPFARYKNPHSFLQAIAQGQRPSDKPIEKLKRSVTTSSEKEIISTLESLMKRCWNQTPSERPSMLEVRDQLQQLLSKTDHGDILQHAVDAVKRLNIRVPSTSDYPCAPLHHFDLRLKTFLQGYQPQKLATQPHVLAPSEEKVQLPLDDIFCASNPSGLPSNVRPAPDFLEKYKISLKNQKYEEAKTMTTKITSMIDDNIDATAKDVREFGIKLREKKLFLESIAIFDAASAMFEKMGKTEENLKWMRFCVQEMMLTNEAMIGDDASMKVTVKNFVIPLMREKLRHIEDTSLVSEQFKCLEVCWVLHYIEYSEYLVDEWAEREKTLRFALTRMKDVFKADDLKFEVYGVLLNNLGIVCDRTSRFEEAASFFKQAIDAYKAAIDYSDEELRKKNIAQSEKNFESCSAENEVTA